MAKRKTGDPYNIRAQVDGKTESALRRKQGQMQVAQGVRPTMDVVVAVALQEWRETQEAA